MGLRIQERSDVVKGAPVVQPGDDLFWFNRPRLILFLIHIVLFTVWEMLWNAFQVLTIDVLCGDILIILSRQKSQKATSF